MWIYLITLIIGVALLTWIIMYIDSRLFDQPKKKSTYIKGIMMSILILVLTLLVLKWVSPSKEIVKALQSGGKSTAKIFSGEVIKIPGIGEEMLAGAPNF